MQLMELSALNEQHFLYINGLAQDYSNYIALFRGPL